MSSLVQSSGAVEFLGDSGSKNTSLTISAGNSVLVPVSLAVFTSTEPTISVSDGTSYSNAVEVWLNPASERKKVALFYLHNSDGGTKTITVSFTGPSSASVYGAFRCYEVSGLDAAAPIATMSNTGSSTTPTSGSSGTLSSANGFCIGATMTQYSGIDLPSSFTNLYLDDSTSGVPPNSHDYQIVSSTSAINIDWGTLAVSSEWAAIGAVFRDAVLGQPAGIRGRGVPGMRLGGQKFGRGF